MIHGAHLTILQLFINDTWGPLDYPAALYECGAHLTIVQLDKLLQALIPMVSKPLCSSLWMKHGAHLTNGQLFINNTWGPLDYSATLLWVIHGAQLTIMQLFMNDTWGPLDYRAALY